jgi:quinol monooxygenase YgiN
MKAFGARIRRVEDVDLVVVTMAFDAADPAGLQALLAKYVVLTRGHPGCRNVDLLVSATSPNRHLVIAKWESAVAQRAHFDSPDMVELAEGCRGVLTGPPQIDLYDPISAYDVGI